jgi:hypothetical protein
MNDNKGTTPAPVIDAELITQPPTALAAPVADITAQLARLDLMEKALDRIRATFIRATVPSDWQNFGGTMYLEGDGGTRIAPLLGLRVTNKRMTREVRDDGVIAVTCTADFESTLLGTAYEDVARTRCDNDGFLKQKRERADIEDVCAAAEKGCIARGVQLLAGLSGITADEMEKRFGFGKAVAAVQFRTGAADAKREDRAVTAGPVADIQRLLYKLNMGDTTAAADMLETLTVNHEKGWAGKRDANKLTEKGVAFVMSKLRAMEAEFDRDIAANEGGGE